MSMIWKLLRKNVSVTQLAGFTLANIVGLAIVIIGLQIYVDVSPIITDEDSFVKKDYIVINKRVNNSGIFGSRGKGFTDDEIKDLETQPWVRKIGKFQSADYRLFASVNSGDRSMSTYMFFESVPKEFLDVEDVDWNYTPGDKYVPIIISKDYLSLYNFGFASSSGLPQLSESMLGAIPLTLKISGNGNNALLSGRIVGFSNRLNTILVPEQFLEWSNEVYGEKSGSEIPARLIIDVSSPGDVKILEYMNAHNYEIAGEKDNSGAAYFLKIVVGIVIGIGVLILALSLGILLLSISLLLQKNKEKMHSLLMLGYDLGAVARPYHIIVLVVNVAAYIVAVLCMIGFRYSYATQLEAMGGCAETIWQSCGFGLLLTVVVVLLNVGSIRHKVRKAF